MHSARDFFRWVLLIGGILVLGITYKANAIRPIIGYPMGVALIASVVWGKGIGVLILVISTCSLFVHFLSPRILEHLLRIEANGYLLGFSGIAIGGFIYWVGIESIKYFCAACSQYLGTSPKVCPRCGSNRYFPES